MNEDIGETPKTLLPFVENNLWGLMDTRGKIVIDATFDYATRSHDGFCEIGTQSGNLAFLNTNTLKLFEIEGWESRGSICYGAIPVRERSPDEEDRPSGYMNLNGELIIPPRFWFAGNFDKYGAIVSLWDQRLLRQRINSEGQFLGEAFSEIVYFLPEGRAAGAKLADYSMVPIRHDGTRIGNRRYKLVCQEIEGKIPVMFNDDEVGWIDLEGDILRRFRAYGIGFHFQNGLIPVQNFEGNWGVMNKNEHWVIDPIYNEIASLGEKRFALGKKKSNGENSYILSNESGESLSDQEFQCILPFHNGIACVYRHMLEGEAEKFVFEPFNYTDVNGVLISERWSVRLW